MRAFCIGVCFNTYVRVCLCVCVYAKGRCSACTANQMSSHCTFVAFYLLQITRGLRATIVNRVCTTPRRFITVHILSDGRCATNSATHHPPFGISCSLLLALFDCVSNAVPRLNAECGRVKFPTTGATGKSS